jgi:hypothetical protein
MFLGLLLRWLPASLNGIQEPFGMGRIVAGDLILAWKSCLRCAVAYVLTAVAFDWLMPIRWRTVLAIAAAAVLGEIVAELVTSILFGSHAGIAIQLIASAIAYSLTLTVSIQILQRRLPAL